ncbi:MAG TPA: hypothetical protein VEA44_16210 [Caulobacter sp.]|nr:hypothetical protein [Caulobacter sp.]
MARLPDRIALDGPRGRRPPEPDHGLGALSQGVGMALGGLSEGLERSAGREAQRKLQDFQLDFQARAAERAAAYDGSTAGFAQAEASLFDQEVAAFEKQVPAHARGQFGELRDRARAGHLSQSIAVEGRARAGIEAERREALDAQAMGAGQQAYLGAKSEILSPLYETFDGSDPDAFLPAVQARHDAALAKGREAVPERLRARYDAWAAGERLKEQAWAMKLRDDREDAQLVLNARARLDTATNQVLSDPTLYEASVGIVDTSLKALDANDRLELEKPAKAQLAVARIQGLANRDMRDQAKAELNSGRYDDVLAPGQKGQLLAGLERETSTDYVRRADVEGRADSDIAAAATGQEPGHTNSAEVESALGPAARVEYDRRMAAAKKLYGAVGPLHELSAEGIGDHLEKQRPDPSKPSYAEDMRVYAALEKAAQEEVAARRRDPAAWAMGAGSGNGPSDYLRSKFEAWTQAPPAQKAKAAQDYARATLARQAVAGIPPPQQRVLPKPVTGAIAEGVKSGDPKTRRENLDMIGRMLDQFGPHRLKVSRELEAAGVPRADIEAVASALEGGDPGLLGSYANATANPDAFKKLDGKAEKGLKDQILRQAKPYLDSLAPLDPTMKHQNGVLDVVAAEARGLVLRGMEPAAAVEAAMKRYDRYSFQDGYRVPKAAASGGDLRLIRGGAKAVLNGVTDQDGKWLRAPAGRPAKVWADDVRRRGVWVTRPDDSGVQLMIGTPSGFFPVLDGGGRPIVRDWRYLIDKGRKSTPRSSVGRLPSG